MSEQEFRLTRSEARNPAVYRDMKARAEKAGKPLQIVEDPELDAEGGVIEPPKSDLDALHVAYTRDAIYVRRELCRQPREYQRISAEARNSSRKLLMVDSFAELDADTQDKLKAIRDGRDPDAVHIGVDPLADRQPGAAS